MDAVNFGEQNEIKLYRETSISSHSKGRSSKMQRTTKTRSSPRSSSIAIPRSEIQKETKIGTRSSPRNTSIVIRRSEIPKKNKFATRSSPRNSSIAIPRSEISKESEVGTRSSPRNTSIAVSRSEIPNENESPTISSPRISSEALVSSSEIPNEPIPGLMEFEYVIPEYQSPNASAIAIDDNDDAITAKRMKRSDKEWVFSATYNTEREALEVIYKEQTWSKRTTTENDFGSRVLFRCNKVKARAKEQCSSGLQILYHSDSPSVSIYRSKNDQNHDALSDKAKQIEQPVIDAIKKYVSEGVSRKQLMNRLHEDKLVVPTKTQINNLYNSFQKEIRGPSIIHLSELVTFLKKHSNVPDDWNQAFVLDYKIIEGNEIQFDFVVSSKKLLANAIGKELFAADTTYKILWQGFPVAPIGTVDKDRHFHLICLCVSTNEKEEDFTFFFQTIKSKIFDIFNGELKPKIILCDACKAISNAFLSVFGTDCLTVMCWFHVKKAVKKNIGQYFPKEMHQSVLDDIDCLQLSTSQQIFEKASLLFLHKYASYEKFVSYFQYEWLEQFRNWYEGAAEKCPSTNNALESFNRYLKEERTLRERLPLAQFTDKLFEWIKDWSVEYDSGARDQFVETPSLTLEHWTKGYQWSRMNKVIRKKTDVAGDYLLIPPSNAIELESGWTERDMWDSFDDFKVNFMGSWKLYFNVSDWEKSICSCPKYLKEYMCKHIVGVALRLKYATAPPEAKNVQIGSKRKRGRPAKAKQALIIQ